MNSSYAERYVVPDDSWYVRDRLSSMTGHEITVVLANGETVEGLLDCINDQGQVVIDIHGLIKTVVDVPVDRITTAVVDPKASTAYIEFANGTTITVK